MKAKIFLYLSILLVSSTAFAQNVNSENVKHISVTGSAEVIVQPDEIELEIILKEYGKAMGETELIQIEDKFLKILEKNGVAKEKVLFNNSDSYYWYYWWSYRDQYHQQKRLNVKLDKSTDFLSLVQDLDFEGVHTLRIVKTSNQELQKLRKEVKIKAIQAAKEKAVYLLESIGEKLGGVISIEEVPDHTNRYYWSRNTNLISNVSVQQNRSGEEIDNIASIKLRYEIKAKFEIK